MTTLPYLTSELPGIGGILRATDDDFVVDELPAYAPSGTGDHVFVQIEKRDLTTPLAVERIAKALGVPARDVGVAGMKDRHAVTRQWISLPAPVTPEQALALAVDGVAILEASRHGNKLRTGHLRGNSFVVRVRQCSGDVAAAQAILAALAVGAPNWYGEQRFGRDGDNAEKGRAIVLGEPPPRDKRLARLLVSALQSELFNQWLIARLADGFFAHVLAGDVLHKVGGGMFTCDDPAIDDARLAAGELVVTGPMFGDRMRAATGVAGDRESQILAASGLPADAFRNVRAIAEGTRRDAMITIGAPSVTAIAADCLEVAFTLPSGAYATVVMRELMKC